MKTEVFMVRNLDGIEVRQSNQTEMFNVTDLVDGYNKARGTDKRLDNYWVNDSTKEFLEALEKQTLEYQGLLKETKRGKLNRGTWVHPAHLILLL